MNGKFPRNEAGDSLDLRPWVDPGSVQPDIYVLGFQELDLSAEAFVFNNSTLEEDWTRCIENALPRGIPYTKVQNGGCCLCLPPVESGRALHSRVLACLTLFLPFSSFRSFLWSLLFLLLFSSSPSPFLFFVAADQVQATGRHAIDRLCTATACRASARYPSRRARHRYHGHDGQQGWSCYPVRA